MTITDPGPDLAEQVGQIALSRREAAWLAGASLGALERAIEEGVVRPARRGRAAVLDADELAVLAVTSSLGVPLPRAIKRGLRAWLVAERPYLAEGEWEHAITPRLVVRDGATHALLVEAARYVAARERWIETTPEVKGGEPVIAGTRIGVRALAGRLVGGEPVAQLAADYPQLPAEALETAAAWAACHPRRGRPGRPWR